MKALKFYKELKESEPSTSSRESEVASADEEAARKYPEKLAKIIKDGEYCAHQVFNADETGLFWKKCQPVLTLQTIAEIKSQTLNACWKAAWPECVSKGNESNRAIVTSEIISIAKEIGGEGFDDFGEHDIEELLVDEALNDDDILESMVDITKDLETVDSEPEEDVTPLDEKLLREGLQLSATRGFLATDHVILNHGQVTWTTPELAPPLITTTPFQREDVSALDRFDWHRCPTRRVFSGTGLEVVTRQATIRYLYHSATPATC
ncbi:uncharacterized protein TNCV_2752651 [Trichonephila clavipes]|nr:uncharacterized protein TNCV_2752651 [Trichonephila clavipes]